MSCVTFIGFGEAASAFADAMPGLRRAYDRKMHSAPVAAAKLADVQRYRVEAAASNAAAVDGAALILSLVTAEQAGAAARETAESIVPGALFCDMNSVAPKTKREAAGVIERAGGRYVDVAVMAPVYPQRRDVPLLVAGQHAAAAEEALRAIGFSNVRFAGDQIGRASAIKMIRSVIVKGIEALTAECLLAAEAAGVRTEVIASLDGSERPRSWAERADYNLDRMIVHGLRRAEEMDEVVKTLDGLATGSAMARATLERQRSIGALEITPPAGLESKLAVLAQLLAGGELGRAA